MVVNVLLPPPGILSAPAYCGARMAVLAAPAEAPFARHVLERTVVLPRQRVLFLPTPKAACTNVLWTLAGLAGLPPDRFDRSPLPEVSPALTVHDMNLWPDELRLIRYEGAERERVLAEDGWLRFSLVRDPAPRLWSGWQSKLLLREPRFAADFGDAPGSRACHGRRARSSTTSARSSPRSAAARARTCTGRSSTT